MNERAKLGKGNKVTVNFGANKGKTGVVTGSYMSNKYATYVVRLDDALDEGLIHGRVEEFTAEKKEKV